MKGWPWCPDHRVPKTGRRGKWSLSLVLEHGERARQINKGISNNKSKLWKQEAVRCSYDSGGPATAEEHKLESGRWGTSQKPNEHL